MNRHGVTLLEVLVAIFVMGIGLLALMVLFPLGALRMAQAIQDDRVAQCARCADTLFRLHGFRDDPMLLNDPTDPFVNPGWINAALKPANPNGPSFPVFVDPTGYLSAAGLNAGKWVGPAAVQDTVARRSVSLVRSQAPVLQPAFALRWFTGLDDIYFDLDGTSRRLTANTIERDIRYSWAYLLKRPRTSDSGLIDLTIVVFNKRTLALSTQLDLNEALFDNVNFV